jgi:hypothetical protein
MSRYQVRTVDRIELVESFSTRREAEAWLKTADPFGWELVECGSEENGRAFIGKSQLEVFDTSRADERSAAEVERDAALAEVERLTEELADVHAVAKAQGAHLAAARETSDAKHGVACREARRQRDHHRESLRLVRESLCDCECCADIEQRLLREREPQLFDEGSE